MAYNPDINSNDRLGFTLFLAAALHGLLIFGVSFNSLSSSESAPSVTVTLATHKSNEAPEDADFIAQENQIGSGTADEEKEITTDQQTPFSNPDIREADVLSQTKASEQETQAKTTAVTATTSSTKVEQNNESQDVEEKRNGQDSEDIKRISAEIASLAAKLDKQKQAFAKRPRERVLTSVSAKRSADAEYLNAWAVRVESVGNQNFPRAAINQKITGSLRLQSTINWDGRLLDAEILNSSGHSVLDNAALQIIRQAAPFLPLPPELRKDLDQIVIIRTWHFEIDGLTTEQTSEQ